MARGPIASTRVRSSGELRRKLLQFGLGLVAVNALLFGALWIAVRLQIVPILTEHVRTKAEGAVSVLDHDLAVPLAAGDMAEVSRIVRQLRGDPDFSFAIVTDPSGEIVTSVGRAVRPRLAGRPLAARAVPEGFEAWAPIDLEGLRMGAVEVGLSNRRVARVTTWLAAFAVVGGLLVFVAAVFAAHHSKVFVTPIRGVIGLSKRFAQGELGWRIVGSPPGELGELVLAINRMADALQARTREIEVKRAELATSLATLSKTRSRLVEASRLAGMAEVATGVLHNVGNVLNSVNVSAQMLEDSLASSKCSLLPRAVELLEQNRVDLASFFTGDPRGQKLPEFLAALAAQIATERHHMLEELSSLRRNVEHLKTVVTSQQSLARSRGVSEVFSVAEVIDTAVGIEQQSFDHADIRLITEIEELPPLNLDKHKLLQILINLLTNARHAVMEATGTLDRCVTVKAERRGDAIAIGVRDNGVGIPGESLTRVFEHGFTTREDGHGFGLHSSALAAREMGGSLQAESEGPGRGATFTVEVPLAVAEAA